jgi:hypothetical protein
VDEPRDLEPLAEPARPLDAGAVLGTAVTLDAATVRQVLDEGEIRLVGRLAGSTNHAMLCRVTLACEDPREPPTVLDAVYKPIAGERPLDDFPDGTLAFREVAAYELSEAAGFGVVPVTVLRAGPFGPGAVQAWIDADPDADPVAMVVGADPRLRRLAVFDAAVNNTDRKAGHLLPLADGRVLGVDHGVCFSPDPKLRTVLWAWRAEPFEPPELELLEAARGAIAGELGQRLRELLAPVEIRATARRIDGLIRAGRFPLPRPDWPAIPWPPV